MPDLITLIDPRRLPADAGGLSELYGHVQAQGYAPRPIVISPSQDTQTTINQVNGMDTAGTASVFVWGNITLPGVSMFSPDGHGETVTLPSLMPFQAGPSGLMSRPCGVVNLEGVGGFYADYLARLNDYLAGRTTFERMGVADDHLVYRTDIAPHGAAMQAQFEAAFGAGSFLRYDSMDGDVDGYTLPQGGPAPYFSELGTHRPTGYGLFSGGVSKAALYYLGTAQAAMTLKPAALFTAIFGSGLMDFGGLSLLAALLAGGLASVWTGYTFPELSRWLAGTETLGQAILRHAQMYGMNGAINLIGFPLLMVPPVLQPGAHTTGGIPPAPPPTTAGATPLTADDLVTIKQMLADTATWIKADYTAAISAAVQAVQTTSAGQSGPPTGTIPATGANGSGTASGGTATVPDFNTPVLAAKTFKYNPTGGAWTFTGLAGLCADGSLFGSPATGGQCAFVQGQGQMSGTLSGLIPGQQRNLNIVVAQRTIRMQAGPQTLNVMVDGKQIGTVQEITGAWQTVKIPFTPTAASHVVTLVGTANGDSTMFVSSVSVS